MLLLIAHEMHYGYSDQMTHVIILDKIWITLSILDIV
jgi:hypothetical protein